jgi:hypothetical protein
LSNPLEFISQIPSMAALLATARLVLAEGVKLLRQWSLEAPDPVTAAELSKMADKFQAALDSTDFAAIGIQAVAELQTALLTLKAPVRHSPTDLQ